MHCKYVSAQLLLCIDCCPSVHPQPTPRHPPAYLTTLYHSLPASYPPICAGWVGSTAKQEGLAALGDCVVAIGDDNDFGLGGNPQSQLNVVRLPKCLTQLYAEVRRVVHPVSVEQAAVGGIFCLARPEVFAKALRSWMHLPPGYRAAHHQCQVAAACRSAPWIPARHRQLRLLPRPQPAS